MYILFTLINNSRCHIATSSSSSSKVHFYKLNNNKISWPLLMSVDNDVCRRVLISAFKMTCFCVYSYIITFCILYRTEHTMDISMSCIIPVPCLRWSFSSYLHLISFSHDFCYNNRGLYLYFAEKCTTISSF